MATKPPYYRIYLLTVWQEQSRGPPLITWRFRLEDPRSGRPDVPITEPYTHADDLKALLDYLGITSAHIIGNSFEGVNAINFALAYPESMRSWTPRISNLGSSWRSSAMRRAGGRKSVRFANGWLNWKPRTNDTAIQNNSINTQRRATQMTHDPRILKHEEQIEQLKTKVPAWIRNLARPETPVLIPRFGPLEGLRVVSTGIIVAQPYIGTKMAEFGAEVIHVERRGGDTFRSTAPLLTRGPRPHSCDEADVAKNKLSLGLDLKYTQGVELLMALWKISDVWMESSAPGTLERAGINNELALAVNPSLVIVRVSTYGQYGKEEYLGRPGYDALAQAFGGMMAITGDPSGPPQRAKTYTGDYLTALTGWAATLMALWEVKKTGRGQVIDLAQFEAVAQTQGNCMPLYTGQGNTYGHIGNRAPGFQPYDTFQCQDGWVFIGALGGAIYSRVPKFLGLDPDEYCYDACSRDAVAVNSPKGQELDQRLREYCRQHTCLEVETALNRAQIGCSRIFGTADQYVDAHYQAREMTVPVLDRQSGVPVRVYGVVPKLSLTPGRVWRGAPAIGEDTTDILTKLLRLSAAEIETLYNEQIVHRTKPFTEPQVEAVNP